MTWVAAACGSLAGLDFWRLGSVRSGLDFWRLGGSLFGLDFWRLGSSLPVLDFWRLGSLRSVRLGGSLFGLDFAGRDLASFSIVLGCPPDFETREFASFSGVASVLSPVSRLLA